MALGVVRLRFGPRKCASRPGPATGQMGLPDGPEYRLAGRVDRHTGTANRSQNQSSLHLRRSCQSERCSIVSLPISARI